MARLAWALGLAAVALAALGPGPAALSALRTLYTLCAWLEGVQEANVASGYMEGNWAPVERELERAECRVEGRLPPHLQGGLYVRTGPNPRCWPPANRHHAFGPDAMLHRISLEGDAVLYSNSWIEPARTGRPCPPTFGAADVIAGGRLALLRLLLLKAMALVAGVPAPPLERSQAGGTSVVRHAGRLLAATEAFLPFEVSVTRDGVRPVGFTTLGGLLEQRVGPAEGTFSAHPRLDPDSGQLYFFSKNSGPDALPLLAFGALHANGTPDRYFHLPVPSPPAAFHHDMVLTDRHAVTVDPSLRRDTARLLAGRGATFFDPDYKMRFAVLPRSATGPEAVRWVECPGPGFIWHMVAAREEQGDKITVWAPKFDSYADEVPIHLPREDPSYLTRFTLDLASGSCSEERVLGLVVERPSTARRLQPDIVYLRSEGKESGEMGGELVKFHLGRAAVEAAVPCGERPGECVLGEPLFVQGEGEEEDAGWLMDIVYFPGNASSAWMVWNAKDLRRVATVHLPQRVPYGVHGLWLDKEFLDSAR